MTVARSTLAYPVKPRPLLMQKSILMIRKNEGPYQILKNAGESDVPFVTEMSRRPELVE
jgi:hypothetical protein